MKIKTVLLGLALLSGNVYADVSVSEGAKTLLRIIGGFVLGLINSFDYLFLLGIVLVIGSLIVSLVCAFIFLSIFIIKKIMFQKR